MFKPLLIMLSSVFVKGGESGAVPFLDYEQRPEAVAIEKSFVEINKLKSGFEILGGLGSLPSVRRGEFVGFSGTEIPTSVIRNEQNTSESLFFEFENFKDELKVLTVQIVLTRKKSQRLYAIDLSVDRLEKETEILWADFKESYRGRIGEASYEGDHNDVAEIRFFLKRSTNAAREKTLLLYQFKVLNLNYL